MFSEIDTISCGVCATEFLLSDYKKFLEHKLSRCENHRKNKNYLKKSYSCFHCDNYTAENADEFIEHFQQIHKLQLLRPVSCDQSVQIADYEEVNFNVLIDMENIAVSSSNSTSDILTDSSDYCKSKQINSVSMKKRDRCCLEDPESGYCDENTACPLLLDGNILNDTSIDTGMMFQREEDKQKTTEQAEKANFELEDMVQRLSNGKKEEQQQRRFSCIHCNKWFNQKVHLNKHILVKHENKKPYQCNICSYQTVEKGYLKTHMRKHTGERPFQCPVCEYRTAQNCALKVHMQRLHPHFSYSCNRNGCTQTFITKFALERHQRCCSFTRIL